MNFKKYMIMASVAAAFLSGAQTSSARPLSEMTLKGDFPFELVFTLDKNQGPQCSVPPVLKVTVHRDHPEHTSTLVLPKDSPYLTAKIISSSPYNSHEVIRHFHDELIVKHADGTKTTMQLFGTRYVLKNIEEGTWTNNLGCSGQFTSTLQ